jgi:4-methyl-5(b-hydroxyethyl)-thiazole monophosphate biosynthesis
MSYCVILGRDFEDIEALAFIDVLRRAKVSLDLYGVGGDMITSRSNVVYKTEKVFLNEKDIDIGKYDGILLPGGPGVDVLAKNTPLLKVIKKFYEAKKTVFAICAAPYLLDCAGILAGKRFTCYPGTEIKSGKPLAERVVIDNNIITSQGVGTALDAAVTLVELFVSKDEAEAQKKKILYHS